MFIYVHVYHLRVPDDSINNPLRLWGPPNNLEGLI